MTNNSKQLIPLDELGAQPVESKAIQALTRTSEFLPQIRVYGSESTIVKEQRFPMGHLGLYFAQDNIVDLDEQFDCLVCSWRPRASIVMGDQPISYYGKLNDKREWECDSSQFVEVKNKAMAKEQGYLVGLEYLLWVSVIEQFGLFLMGNPTLRRESSNMKALLGMAATVKIKLIKTSKYVWHGVQIFQCTTPFDLPSVATVKEQVDKFNVPKDSEVELVDDSDAARAR